MKWFRVCVFLQFFLALCQRKQNSSLNIRPFSIANDCISDQSGTIVVAADAVRLSVRFSSKRVICTDSFVQSMPNGLSRHSMHSKDNMRGGGSCCRPISWALESHQPILISDYQTRSAGSGMVTSWSLPFSQREEVEFIGAETTLKIWDAVENGSR